MRIWHKCHNGFFLAGENYRFGYKATGDSSELVRLCDEFGMGAYIIKPVMDKNRDSIKAAPSNSKERGQVSSTRVRYALSIGDMSYVSELLGRQHRLLLTTKDQEAFTGSKNRVSAPKSCLLNLPPREGLYENCSLLINDENLVSCRVVIDTTHIHLEFDEVDPCIRLTSQGSWLLGVEFGV